MSRKRFIKELRELVDQIEALPSTVKTPTVEFTFRELGTIKKLRAVRKLMLSPQCNSNGGMQWLTCEERNGIELAAFYAPGLLGPAVRERVVEVVVESTHDLSVLD